ncbi:hypothetical protein GXW82_34890 [Streptacidiphilus sp. 4-A2]|nr:hypothetical protein [Streptacidiphilus sp. 4-A2]
MRVSKLAQRGLGLAVVTALASGGVVALAGTAFASDQLDIGVNPYNVQLPTVLNGVSSSRTLKVQIYHDQAEKVGAATVTVNASGLSRIAQVGWPKGCTHVGDVGTCKNVTVSPINAIGTALNLTLKALPGARSGAQGSVSIKASVPGLGTQTNVAPVSVQTGTDLVVAGPVRFQKVKVGSTVVAPLSWTNTGDETAPRTQLTLQALPGLTFKQHLKGCTYTAGGQAVCTFNSPLKPGQTVRFPVALNVTKEAWVTGLAVQVAPLGAGKAKAPTDINQNDQYSEVDVFAVNTAHFAAIGDTVHGAAGQTVPVTVGMRSYGPAYIIDRSGGEAVGDVSVEFPKGTTVTAVPQNCFTVAASATSAAHYNCEIPAGVAPGAQNLYTFSIRVDQVVANAQGKVWLSNELSDISGKPVSYPWDPSSAGHTAALVLNP